MNFLAHVYLSGHDEQLILGNLIADAVKGKLFEKYDQKVQNGIKLHRLIDKFTDEHEVVKQSKRRLEERYKRFAGIIVDIYYDHFLSANFNTYSEVPLVTIANNAYEILIRNYEILPPVSKRMLPYMVNRNWFMGYADTNYLVWVFHGMSRRTSFNSGMETAVEDLRADYLLYEEEFKLFFPELMNYCRKERNKLL